VAGLMERPWFRRAWVLQEVGLARRPIVLYGAEQFDYRAFVRMMRWVRTQAWTFRYQIYVIRVHYDWLDWSDVRQARGRPAGVTLFDLLDHASLLNCADPRDRVYAFLGHPLAQRPDGTGPLVRPDYTKPVAEVYREIMEVLLKVVGPRVLATVDHTETSISEVNVPSWVVRWDISNAINPISQLPRQVYRAGGPANDPGGIAPFVEGRYLMAQC
jgi:hypothetical protein